MLGEISIRVCDGFICIVSWPEIVMLDAVSGQPRRMSLGSANLISRGLGRGIFWRFGRPDGF